MRFRVIEGQQVQRGSATYTAGEEFEVTGDEAQGFLNGGQAVRIDKPKSASTDAK
ncbi:MAG: hypothetical protein M3Q68_01245 [Actinomycetota bacterium]|nr:hypothetical protein [Actinomycetota bacterium]